MTTRSFLTNQSSVHKHLINNKKILVLEAEEDHVFAGQPVLLAEALGSLATYIKLGTADGAKEHCHVGAADKSSGVVMDWLEDQIKRV